MGTQKITYEQGTVDTGDNAASAVHPVADGEFATAAVFGRPVEALRRRSETVREALEELRYRADAESAVLIEGGEPIQWNGAWTASQPSSGRFSLAAASYLLVRPFLSPSVCTPGTVNASGVDIRATTAVTGGVNPARAYGQLGDLTHPGAGGISVELVPSTTLTAVAATVSAAPGPRHIVVQFNPTTHTQNALVTYLTSGTDAGAVAFRALGLTAALHAGSAGTTLLTAVPRTYLSGALDAEVHYVDASTVDTFFGPDATPTNRMENGDTLAIWYESLVAATAGGRRQALDELPEGAADVPAGNLFLVRLHPERVPYAIPLCTVENNELVWANGKRYVPGIPGPSVNVAAVDLPVAGHVQVGSTSGAGARVDCVAGGTQGQLTLTRVGGPATPVPLTAQRLELLISGDVVADSLHTHNAAQIRFPASGSLVSTNVQGAIQELDQKTASVVHTHQATEVSVVPAGTLAATNVQNALAELDAEKSATTHVHRASTIINTPSGSIQSADVQGAINELEAEKAPMSHGHLATEVGFRAGSGVPWNDVQAAISVLNTNKSETTHVHQAGAVTVVPAGNLSATDVQSALAELDAEKAPVAHPHQQSDVANLVASLASKADAAHTHPALPRCVMPAAQVVNASGPGVDVVGYAFDAAANEVYEFEVFVSFAPQTAGTTFSFGFAGPGDRNNATRLHFDWMGVGATMGQSDEWGLPIPYTAANVGGWWNTLRIRGYLRNGNTAGTVQLRVLSGVGNAVLSVGSGGFIRWTHVVSN